MKKCFVLLLCLLMVSAYQIGYAQSDASLQPERTVASYVYTMADGGSDYVENLIFNEDVVIGGNNAQIIFSNCEFNGDIILTADEATRVMLLGCDVNGTCVMSNNVAEATLEYANPKFMTDVPITVTCEDCVGSVIALGNFEVVFNGETYSMADSQLFGDTTGPDAGYVPYTGQQASYYCLAQWYENGQPNRLILCEFDPTM